MPPRRGTAGKGHTIPYGTFSGASQELIKAYYYFGYKEDSMWPELPCPPQEDLYIDPEEELSKKELAEHAKEMLETLTPREAKVLRMRCGIELECDYTLEEVGRTFDVTRERIRQIEAKALRKMKHPDRSAVLRMYVAPELYKTTLEKDREVESRQEAWRKARERQHKLDTIEKNMPPKKRTLWGELKPALEDASWVKDLKTSKPEMYQELKELVGHLWEMNANEIWEKYTKEQYA
jgi:DNA-binding CsgD family transcriptional regulator